MKTAIIIAMAALLAGCGSTQMLENRAVCTVDGSEAHVISKWGPVGIGAKLAEADARVMCKRPV